VTSDGANLGFFPVATFPDSVAFDGENIWGTDSVGDSVVKFRASDGLNLGTFSAGAVPRSIAFDGANMWVTNGSGNTVTKP